MKLLHYTYTETEVGNKLPEITRGIICMDKITHLSSYEDEYCVKTKYYVHMEKAYQRVDKYIYEYLIKEFKAKEIKIPYNFNNI